MGSSTLPDTNTYEGSFIKWLGRPYTHPPVCTEYLYIIYKAQCNVNAMKIIIILYSSGYDNPNPAYYTRHSLFPNCFWSGLAASSDVELMDTEDRLYLKRMGRSTQYYQDNGLRIMRLKVTISLCFQYFDINHKAGQWLRTVANTVQGLRSLLICPGLCTLGEITDSWGTRALSVMHRVSGSMSPQPHRSDAKGDLGVFNSWELRA